MPPVKRFRVMLEKHEHSEAALFTLPFDASKFFGTRARVPVRGTINDFPFRGSIFPTGDGRHYMVVRKEIRDGAGVRGGQLVTIVMERDDEPRVVTPPEDLARAIRKSREARAAWERLSYTHQKEYADAVASAKRPETRERRIEKALAELSALAASKK